MFTRKTSVSIGESTSPAVHFEVFLTGAKGDRLFEYQESIGWELQYFKERMEQLWKQTLEAYDRIKTELEQAGIEAKEGRIESL